MASPDTRPGRGVVYSSSLSKDHILRKVQMGVARREGRAVIVDDGTPRPYTGPKLNLSGKVAR